MKLGAATRVLVAVVLCRILGEREFEALIIVTVAVLFAMTPALLLASLIALNARWSIAWERASRPSTNRFDSIAFWGCIILAAVNWGYGLIQAIILTVLIATMPAARLLVAGHDQTRQTENPLPAYSTRVFFLAVHQVYLIALPLVVLALAIGHKWFGLQTTGTSADGQPTADLSFAFALFLVLFMLDGLSNPWNSDLSIYRRIHMSWSLRADPQARLAAAHAEGVFDVGPPSLLTGKGLQLKPTKRQQRWAGVIVALAIAALAGKAILQPTDQVQVAEENTDHLRNIDDVLTGMERLSVPIPSDDEPQQVDVLTRILNDPEFDHGLIEIRPFLTRPSLDQKGLVQLIPTTREPTPEQNTYPGRLTIAVLVFLMVYLAPALGGLGELAPLTRRNIIRFLGVHGLLIAAVSLLLSLGAIGS